jgi:hypothetical protein
MAVALYGAAVSVSDVYQTLLGRWSGTLEYRDFGNDKRVKLPTVLDTSLSADGQGMTFKYVYDDGPGKIVKETETIRVDLAAGTYTVEEDDGGKTVYKIAKLEGFTDRSGGSLLLSGSGMENKVNVEVRTTIRCTASSLSVLRETRSPGEEFKFRHQYVFTRED